VLLARNGLHAELLIHPNQMKIVVASNGRAHLLDCARELQNQGFDVTYFCVTHKNTFKKYGLKKGGINLSFIVWPFLLARKFFKWFMPYDKKYIKLLDEVVCALMPRCDVFIAQSPYYPKAMEKAKRKYGAIAILDRGSSHVRKFNDLGVKVGIPSLSENYMNYDAGMYDKADYLAIASDFVRDGFREYGFPEKKLFVNPYGVSLKHFAPTACSGEYDAIVVGQWGKRKGHRLVVEAFAGTNIQVLHVGSTADLDFPELPNFHHVNPVPEYKLAEYYSRSKVFLFPSEEDGFGLVLLQAAACGLPIVCSTNCGGPTLRNMIAEKSYIYVMKEQTADELRNGFHALANSFQNGTERNYLHGDVQNITWAAYGKRYAQFLNTIK